MAKLSLQDRAALLADVNQDISRLRQTTDGTRANWKNLVDALDDFIDNNAAGINSSIPLPERTIFTAAEKALALMYVVKKRYLTGA